MKHMRDDIFEREKCKDVNCNVETNFNLIYNKQVDENFDDFFDKVFKDLIVDKLFPITQTSMSKEEVKNKFSYEYGGAHFMDEIDHFYGDVKTAY